MVDVDDTYMSWIMVFFRPTETQRLIKDLEAVSIRLIREAMEHRATPSLSPHGMASVFVSAVYRVVVALKQACLAT